MNYEAYTKVCGVMRFFLQFDEFWPIEDFYRHLMVRNAGVSITRNSEVLGVHHYDDRNNILSKVGRLKKQVFVVL